MTLGLNIFKANTSSKEKLAEFKDRKEENPLNSICKGSHYFRKDVFPKRSLPLISISIIAVLLLVLPACAKTNFNESADENVNTNTGINQSVIAYLNGFNEGYEMGAMRILAQSNATYAEAYNVLAQRHNDLINKTLDEEMAESNQLAMAPMPVVAITKKRVDPWDL